MVQIKHPSPTGTVAVADTAAMALSSALYDQYNIVPTQYYEINDQYDDVGLMNLPEMTRYYSQNELSVLDAAETLNNFLIELTSNAVDLDQEIVEAVNDNFWDLL